MIRYVFFSAMILILTFEVRAQSNYCNMTTCKLKKAVHVACGNPTGAWNSTNCPSNWMNRSIIYMGIEERAQILFLHNKLRNNIALGINPRFKKAARMAEMTWDYDLENNCKLNVKKCVMEHDQCIATDKFPHPGQNLYASANNGAGYLSFNTTVYSAIEFGWYAENKQANQSDIDMCCNYGSRGIGHFTEMMIDRSYKVGCAMSNYMVKAPWKFTLFCCNYANVNSGGSPIYIVAKNNTGESCKAMSKNYSGLCAVGEYP